MKYLDPTFWKFVVAFLTIILVVLVATGAIASYQDGLQLTPNYQAN